MRCRERAGHNRRVTDSREKTAVAPSVASADVLEALAEAAQSVLARRPLEDALAAIIRAVVEAAAAEAAVVRVASDRDGDFVLRAVHARTSVLAAELEGSKLAAADLPEGEVEYAQNLNGRVPPAIRRAAARSGADVVRVVPVSSATAPAATLELYGRGEGFSRRTAAFARLAAAHIGLALELSHALAVADAASSIPRGSLELVGGALAAGSDEAEAAEQIVRVACEATGAARSLLWRIEAEGRPSFLAAHGFDGEPPDVEASADAVRIAVERRDADGGSAGAQASAGAETMRTVILGEPPAGALQLLFDGMPAEADGEHLSAFAARVAVALRRTRRAQLVTLALRRSQTIVAVISQAIARLSLTHTLETAVARISELTASSHVAIYLREGERLTVAASRGLEYPHTGLAERLLELALGPFRGRGFLFIDDMRRDARLAGLEDVLAETGIRRALVVPLVVRDEVIGVLAVYKSRPRPYRIGEEGLLIALSSQLAVAVQNARLHEQTKELGSVLERTLAAERKAARQLRGLFQISHSFARSLSLEATLEAVAKTMVELLELDAAAIRMPDERREVLVPRAIYVADSTLREAAATILARPQPIGSPLVGGVLQSGHPVLLAARDGRGVDDADDLLAPFLRKGSTAAVLPMATPGEVLGTLTLLSLDPARPLDEETVETAMTVTAQAALAIDNARLYQQQRDFAETMQRSLLPREIPEIRGLEVGHVYQSSARVDVGGDVYDFLSLEDGRLAVILGDVTGKGIQAAADMAMAKFSFRALARSYPEPAEFLAKANDVVIEEIAVGKFITMVYAVIDPAMHEVAYSSAGHPPPRFVGADGTVSTLSTTGLALGIERDQEYPAERATLEPGAVLVLFTDGVIEARREGDVYGEGRLDTFLSKHVGLSAQELAEALLADCRAFAEGEVADDCAVVCLRLAR
jgi:serine phosphatase RsbU (regulator of sigma subunit)